MPQKDQPRAVVSKAAYNHLDVSRPKGCNYLLAIAIDNYVHQPKLSNAVKDAEDIVQILVQRYDFQEDKVIKLYNENANKPQIFKALENLATTITTDDNVLIYYAGHGYYHTSNKTGHLIPQSAKSHVWEYLSNADLKNHLRAINSLHTFLIIDSCFSGSLFSQTRIAGRSTEESMAIFAERVAHFPSRWCLAAGMIEEVSDGLHGENSPFAEAIISYLQRNRATKFPVSALIQYVKRVTPNNAKQTPIGGILLNVKDLGGEFIFTLKEGRSQTAITEQTISEGTNTGSVRNINSTPHSVPVAIKEPKTSITPNYTKWILIGLLGLALSFGGYYFFTEETPPIVTVPPPQKEPTTEDLKTAYDRTLLAANTAYQTKNYLQAKEKYKEARNYGHRLGYLNVSIDQAIAACEVAIKEGGNAFYDSMMTAVKETTPSVNGQPNLKLLPMTTFSICGEAIYTSKNNFEHEFHKLTTKNSIPKNAYLKMDKFGFTIGAYKLDRSPKSKLQFDRLVKFLECYPHLKIRICTYVKSLVVTKNTHANELKYATIIKKALLERGIDSQRIATTSLDALKPIPLNQTTNKNGRVEVFIQVK